MSRLVFLAPLRLEAAALRRGAPGADVTRIGMGPGRATIARNKMMRSRPHGDAVIVAGVAGALDDGLVPGQVVVASSLQRTDTDEIIPVPGAVALAEVLVQAGLDAVAAPVLSSPQIIRGGRERRDGAARGARAVDMESVWCAPLRSRHRFAVVRVILDTPERELFSRHALGSSIAAWRSLVMVARTFAHEPTDVLFPEPQLDAGGH